MHCPNCARNTAGLRSPHPFVADALRRVQEAYRARMTAAGINPAMHGASALQIIKYICGYHFAHTARLTNTARTEVANDEAYRSALVVNVTESLFILENIKTSAVRLVNEYNPVYCRFNILLDFLLGFGVKVRAQVAEHSYQTVMKLFETAFLKLKGIMSLIAKGLEKEGVIVWRSLHELECVIAVLCRYGKAVIEEFESFDRFGVPRDEMSEEVAAEYDEKIKAFGINIKNNNEVDHFENYGWICAVPDMTPTKWNLNFRFLEDLAGLGEKYKEYQVACDASHMNAKTMKWNKQKVLDFVVKRCFNSAIFLIGEYTKFLEGNGIALPSGNVGKMIGDLKSMIDIFLPPIPSEF